MLYETFNANKESFGQDFFTSRLDGEIDDEEYGVSMEDRKLNKEFYGFY